MIIDYTQGEYEQGQVYFELGHIDSISVYVAGVFEVISLILNNFTLKYDLENYSLGVILNNYTVKHDLEDDDIGIILNNKTVSL